MDQDLLIVELFKTPAPTGLALGKGLDAWAEWCREFTIREKEEADAPRSMYEL